VVCHRQGQLADAALCAPPAADVVGLAVADQALPGEGTCPVGRGGRRAQWTGWRVTARATRRTARAHDWARACSKQGTPPGSPPAHRAAIAAVISLRREDLLTAARPGRCGAADCWCHHPTSGSAQRGEPPRFHRAAHPISSPRRDAPAPARSRVAGNSHIKLFSLPAAGQHRPSLFPGSPQQNSAGGGFAGRTVTASTGDARLRRQRQAAAGRPPGCRQRPRPAVRPAASELRPLHQGGLGPPKALRLDQERCGHRSDPPTRGNKEWPTARAALSGGRRAQPRLRGWGRLHAIRSHPRGFRAPSLGRIAFGSFQVFRAMIMPCPHKGGFVPGFAPLRRPVPACVPSPWIVRARVPPLPALLAREAGEPFVERKLQLPAAATASL